MIVVPKSQIDEIHKRTRSGETPKYIATCMGIKYNRVMYFIRKGNLPLNKKDKALDLKIKTLYESGMPRRIIADELDETIGTVDYSITKQGLAKDEKKSYDPEYKRTLQVNYIKNIYNGYEIIEQKVDPMEVIKCKEYNVDKLHREDILLSVKVDEKTKKVYWYNFTLKS